mmetsp:Transcript_23760/g.62103  ORF Transcript_23760/g.62103 Transcript_23760/m.62103 type:complete len:723 (-) Transcript_23760:134-2302(-)
MVDFVGIDEFFSASGTFMNADLTCTDATTTHVVSSTGYDTETSSPEYQFSPDLAYGSPYSNTSDDGGLVPASMQVETPPLYDTSEPPDAPSELAVAASAAAPDTGSPFNPFEEAMLVGKATANPLYDSNEALNQLVGPSRPAVSPVSVAPSMRPAAALAPAAAAQTTTASIGPSSKKKRKAPRIKQEEPSSAGAFSSGAASASGAMVDGGARRLTFLPREADFAKVYTADLQEISICDFLVEADKGFNFSPIDNAFVCQKKNHFQLSAMLLFTSVPRMVYHKNKCTPIHALRLAVWGLKDEDPPASVGIEQSHVDRTKKLFIPVPIELDDTARNRTTFSRLHFCETTANNMRKKGKPNPEQRYFKLLVELHAVVEGGELASICCLESQRIIVRASNPGQFEGEIDLKWQKGKVADSIVHHGNVGINNARPFSALTVSGDVAVTGNIMHPSDLRIKERLEPMDGEKQLENVRALRLYEYEVRESWAEAAGRDTDNRREVGVIAQNVQRVLPDAVTESGANFELQDGSKVDNLLIVDKDRIFMENVGAVQELCRMTENMDLRIRELEILKESVESGAYAGQTVDGDFGYGDTRSAPKRRNGRGKGKKKKKVMAITTDDETRGEWETLTHPGWQQIPVKPLRESFPIDRMLCYIVGALTVFALLVVIVVLVAQREEDGGGAPGGGGQTTLTPLTAAGPVLSSTDPVITTLTTLTSSLTSGIITPP